MKISTALNQFVADIHVDALPHWFDMFEVDLDGTEAEMRTKLAEAMTKARAA